MIIDVSLILVFLVSFWIGWSMRIYLDWLRLMWIILYALLVWTLLPYFMKFVEHSSANFSFSVYYTFGILMAVLIFLSFLMLLRNKKTSSTSVRRLVGSLVLAMVSGYSLLIVFRTMDAYGWVDPGQSFLFSIIPE